MNFQNEKKLILDYYQALESNKTHPLAALEKYGAAKWYWRGYHPFNELSCASEIAECFWKPFNASFSSWHRRQDIFFAGQNEMDGFHSVWVVSMGHLVGLFDQNFLNIPANNKMTFFRYCEFNRVENDTITETAFYFDLPHLMAQIGQSPFATQRAAQLVQPGPIGHDGLLFDVQNPKETTKTLAIINAMIRDLGQWKSGLLLEDELARTWHDNMIWWGPTGIGATYTIERYAKQHSGPFRAAFTERSKNRHLCRLAEGCFGGFFGWPNFTAKLQSVFLGIPPSDIISEFRVIDIYRRAGNKLAENWIFIDLPHWMKQNGIDILVRKGT